MNQFIVIFENWTRYKKKITAEFYFYLNKILDSAIFPYT